MARISVSESEYQLLRLLEKKGIKPGKEYSTDEIADMIGMSRSSIEALLRLLASKGLVELRERVVEEYVLTDEARKYLEEGFPEEKLVRLLVRAGGELGVEEVNKVLGKEAGIALANASRKGWVKIQAGKVVLVIDPSRAVAEERAALEKIMRGERLSQQELRMLRRRKLVDVKRKRITLFSLPKSVPELLSSVVVEVGALTRELIESGRWRKVRLREYDVRAQPPKRLPGRLNFFAQFIEHIRDIMKELGFTEIEALPVELEFWNYDVLFQPQFHPARAPSDTFYLSSPSEAQLPEQLAENVRIAHEEGIAGSTGWRYKWDPRKAARLILRSHTTAVSARILSTRPSPPFRYFSIGRVYRVETIDPKHLPEFHQVDGIASEDGVNLRWLIGMLSEFLERLGFREYKFRPAYFPFTEPSVEGYVKIGETWLEILGAGLFRPEMLATLGVDYPVAAWGMGIERLAMALYDLRDIRQLYSTDVEFLASMPSRWWIYAGTKI